MLPVVSAAAQKLSEKSVAYTYDAKTSIEYSLTYTGFKEDIVVSEYTGQTEYDFTLRTGGLKLVEKNGSYALTDGDGNIKATLGDIIVFTADERNNTMGRLSAKTVTECEEYTVTIILDADYLADEKTVYPIRIDPTVEITYENNGAGAIHDVTLNSLTDSSPTSASIFVGKRQEYGIARVLMKFPGLNLSSLGDNITITNATVEIRDVLCEGSEMNVSCYVFAGNEWDENTVEWANVSPNSYSTFLSSNVISFNNGYALPTHFRYSFDITSAVQGWKTGNCNPNKGIMFKADSSVENASTYEHRTFAAYNRGEHRPSLSVTYIPNTTGLVSEGTYYLNNKSSGNYLRGNVSGVLSAESGLLSSLGNSIQWNISPVSGGYVIRSVANSKKYLGVTQSSTTLNMSVTQSPLAGGSIAEPNGSVLPDLGEPKPDLITVNGAAIPEKCIWTITTSIDGGVVLINKSTYFYLYASNGYLGLTGAPSNATTWRIISTSSYGNTSSYANREMTTATHINSHISRISEQRVLTITKQYNNEIWVSPSDFVYSEYNQSVISIDADTGKITGLKKGGMYVRATHKVTNLTFKFFVTVEETYLYVTERLPGLEDTGEEARDMHCSDKSKTDLYAMNLVVGDLANLYDLPPASSTVLPAQGPEALKDYMRQLPGIFAVGDSQMRTVAENMVEHFLDGSGTPYIDAVLTNRVKNHQNTINFVDSIENEIISNLKLNNNDLYNISKTSAFKTKMDSIAGHSPSYNLPSDYTNGLKICLNGIWGLYVKITNFYVNGNDYSITIEYVLFDHFGLDDGDITKSGWYSQFLGYTSQFGSWFVLQRYKNCNELYKPFVTYISFEETYSGKLA